MSPPADGLVASGLSIGYGRRDVVHSIDLAIPASAFTVLVGPNGSGKSTLLAALAGMKRPSGGGVTLGGSPLSSYPRKALARRIGFLPQSPQAPEGLSVVELVRQGRYPYRGLFSRWNATDERACEDALTLTSLQPLRERALHTLSGGQRQRAWIALALAQETGIMLLDEPTTYLDIAHQIEVLDLLKTLVREKATTVVAVLHDLNQASRHADHIVMMRDGTVTIAGAPSKAMTPRTVAEAFGVRSRVVADPVDGTQFIVPLGRQG